MAEVYDDLRKAYLNADSAAYPQSFKIKAEHLEEAKDNSHARINQNTSDFKRRMKYN